MPKAEVGSTKHLAKQMKSKGLQRLRWYCQICEKQCRDENGFKQHTMSEGHVRAMLVVGEDPRKAIREYSQQFFNDFIQLLRTSYGEKKVHMNQFYQEYIHDKQHVHMNATQWPSLTEFAKHLGREGICRVEEGERGLEIQWIDDSAAAIRRREEIRKTESRAKGDEEIEARLLGQQIKRAQEAAREKEAAAEGGTGRSIQPEVADPASILPVKVSLSLKAKAPSLSQSKPKPDGEKGAAMPINSLSRVQENVNNGEGEKKKSQMTANDRQKPSAPAKISMSLASKGTSTNPLAKRNPLAKKKENIAPEPEKKMSNAARIMKEEMERKRMAEERGYGGGKRQKLG